jgi:ADP-heptose:LPS heptosyltransferase
MRRLLIRPGAIGDCIVSLPALEALSSHYTEIWVAEQNVPLIRFASRVRAISSTGLDLLEIPDRAPAQLVDLLSSFDSIVSWYGSNRQEFRSAVSRLALPFHFFQALPQGGSLHAIDYYLAQAATLSHSQVEPVPAIQCPRIARSSVVIHPFSGSARKNWPLESFRDVARALEPKLHVEWCAGPAESMRGAYRFDDLYELACWLAGARLYIGNDSGITHLAAAAGTPIVAIFVSTDPAIWAPRGKAVRVLHDPDRHDVIQAARDAIELIADGR